MPSKQQILCHQIELIHQAMQQAGLWSAEMPAWIYAYEQGPVPDVWQWMQYIYLPMRLAGTIDHYEYLAPKINAHIKNNPALTPILQLIIELDALTPAIPKSKPSTS